MLALWIPAFLFVDPDVFASPAGRWWLRAPTAAVLLALFVYLRRPRARRSVEFAATLVFSLVFGAFGPATLFANTQNALNIALSITIAAMAVSAALVLSWRSTAVLCLAADLAMLGFGLARDPVPHEYMLVVSVAFLVYPIVVFAAASRDRWQRSEIDARERLREAHEQLRRDERRRTQLFVNLSHDFRSPLSVIRSEVEYLRGQHATSPGPLAHSLGLVDSNAAAIVDLVDQVLELARLDAGKTPCAPVACDAAAIAREIAAQVQPSRATSGLVVRDPERAISAHVDPAHLRRIVTNLVANALRHVAAEGGCIELRASLGEDGSARVDVTDNGPGIPVEQRASLFERFASFQSEGSTASGIGLALAHELARLNGGDLALLEDADGTGGATFRLTLPAGAPLADPAPGAAPIVPRVPRALAPPVASAHAGTGPLVLLVEDNADLRGSMIRHLVGFTVLEAWSLKSALDVLGASQPSAIVADVMLPDGDGYQLLEIVRAGRRFARVPFVLVSALGDPSERTRGIVAGAADYLAKPFSGEELRARVASALGHAERHAAALESQREDLTMELHDGVCGKLTRTVLLLSSAVAHAPHDPTLAAAHDEVTQGLAEARGLLDVLGVKPTPFVEIAAQLRWRFAELCDRAGIALEFSSTDDGQMAFVQPAVAHALARIARESATNTIRHAAATQLRVHVSSLREELRLVVQDNGGGCRDGWEPGLGLNIIRRRTTRQGGGVRFGPTATGGFMLEAWLCPNVAHE
ncbi:MAG: ATP-binding protein [Kofleriaceae bacterium]